MDDTDICWRIVIGLCVPLHLCERKKIKDVTSWHPLLYQWTKTVFAFTNLKCFYDCTTCDTRDTWSLLSVVFLLHLCKMLIESDDSLDSFEEVVNSVVFVR